MRAAGQANPLTSLLRVVVACVKHDSCLVWEDRTMKNGTGASAECSRCGKYLPDSGSPATPEWSRNLRVSVGAA